MLLKDKAGNYIFYSLSADFIKDPNSTNKHSVFNAW